MKCNVSTEHTLKRMEYQCEFSTMCVCLWYGMHLVVVVCARPCKRMYLWYIKYIYIYLVGMGAWSPDDIRWNEKKPKLKVAVVIVVCWGVHSTTRNDTRSYFCCFFVVVLFSFIYFHIIMIIAVVNYNLQYFFLFFVFFFLCVWIWEMRKCIGNVVRIVWSQQSHTLILMAGGTWIILFCRSMSKTTIRRDHSILENYFSAWHNNKHHCIVSVFVVFSISFFLYISIFLLLLLVRWLLLLLSVAVVKPAFYHIFNSISSDL